MQVVTYIKFLTDKGNPVRASIVTLAAAFAIAGPASGFESPQPKAAPPDVKSFFKGDTTQSVQLSPSGRWLAILDTQSTGRNGIRVIDLEGKEQPRVIAMMQRLDLYGVRWVSDDWLVFKVFADNDRSGESYGGGLMAVRRDGERLRPIIKRTLDSLFPDAGQRALEGNHSMLGLGKPGTNEIVVGEHHLTVDYRGISHVTLRTLDVATGDTRSYFRDTPAPPERIQSWLLDSRGEPRVAYASKDGKTRMYWADPKTREWRKLAEFAYVDRGFWPAYVDEKDQLFVTALNAQSHLWELRKFDFAKGAPEAEAVLSVPGFDVDPTPITDRGDNKVHGVSVMTDAPTPVWHSPAMFAIQAKVDAMLRGRVNILTCRPCDSPKTVLIYSYSDTTPGDYLIYRPAEDKFERIASRREGHRADVMANVEFHRTTTRDGADLPVWITRTRSGPAGPRPAVVMVHGGPWARGASWGWEKESQFLATRGYVVITPEFRGSTGFGDQHFRAGWKQWGQRMQDDVNDALRFAVDKGLVDPKRVCIAGASYGGYATLMGLARDPELFKCGVAWVAVSDPRLMYSVHWSDVSTETKEYTMPVMVGDLQKDAAMLEANAPIALASKIKAPLLLAYGQQDRRVPLVHGEKMRAALIAAGTKPEWVVYGNEGHGWENSDTEIDFWTRVERFLEKNLK